MSLSLAESWNGEAAVTLKVQFHSFLYTERPAKKNFSMRNATWRLGFIMIWSNDLYIHFFYLIKSQGFYFSLFGLRIKFCCYSETDAEHRIIKTEPYHTINNKAFALIGPAEGATSVEPQKHGGVHVGAGARSEAGRSQTDRQLPGPVNEAVSPVTWAARLLRRRLIFPGSCVSWWGAKIRY